MCLYMYVSMFMYIKITQEIFIIFEFYVENQYKQECKNLNKKYVSPPIIICN